MERRAGREEMPEGKKTEERKGGWRSGGGGWRSGGEAGGVVGERLEAPGVRRAGAAVNRN